MLKKEQAIALYDGSVRALASDLNCTTAAIYMWRDGEPIPDLPYMRLRFILKPEAFDADGNLITTDS
jgi:hypothetical protein